MPIKLQSWPCIKASSSSSLFPMLCALMYWQINPLFSLKLYSEYSSLAVMPYFGFPGSTIVSVLWPSPSWFAVLLTSCTGWSSEMFFTSPCELGSIVDQQLMGPCTVTEEDRVCVVTPSAQPCAYSLGVLLKLLWKVEDPPWTFCFCSQNHFWCASFFSACQSTSAKARVGAEPPACAWEEGWEKSRIFWSIFFVSIESNGVYKA